MTGQAHSNRTTAPLSISVNGSGPRRFDVPVPTTVFNLASPATSFVGRKADVANIIELLCRAECRLVTLIGPGGSGKSRLALRVGEELAATRPEIAAKFCPDGIVWISLQPVTNSDQIVSAIVKALGWRYRASAGRWRGCLWPSNWRPRGCATCRVSRLPLRSSAGWRSCGASNLACPTVTARCTRSSTSRGQC